MTRPYFLLEKDGIRWSGSIISPSFRGRNDLKRQVQIMDALEDKFGASSRQLVGLLLAYTPDEWDMDLEGSPPRRKHSYRTFQHR